MLQPEMCSLKMDRNKRYKQFEYFFINAEGQTQMKYIVENKITGICFNYCTLILVLTTAR